MRKASKRIKWTINKQWEKDTNYKQAVLNKWVFNRDSKHCKELAWWICTGSLCKEMMRHMNKICGHKNIEEAHCIKWSTHWFCNQVVKSSSKYVITFKIISNEYTAQKLLSKCHDCSENSSPRQTQLRHSRKQTWWLGQFNQLQLTK